LLESTSEYKSVKANAIHLMHQVIYRCLVWVLYTKCGMLERQTLEVNLGDIREIRDESVEGWDDVLPRSL